MGIQDGGDEQVRPADVLLCRAQDISTARGAGNGRVALDVGIICPQAAGHLGAAVQEPLGAAEAYARTKCARGDMERRCQQAGVVFQPLIFESLGGVASEAERVLKCLNKAVAGNTDTSKEVVATQFWHRVSIDMLRGSCRAFHRRVAGNCMGENMGLGAYRGMGGLSFAGGL